MIFPLQALIFKGWVFLFSLFINWQKKIILPRYIFCFLFVLQKDG